MTKKKLQVFCTGTADTKLDELRFLSQSVDSHFKSFPTSNSTSNVQDSALFFSSFCVLHYEFTVVYLVLFGILV